MKLTTKSTKEITWKEIKEMVDREEITLKVGDEIEEVLKNDESLWLVVAAVDHYQPGEIIFAQKNIVGFEKMNECRTNEGGWPTSKLNEKMDSEIYRLLPSDLKEVITKRTITQERDGELVSCSCNLWLPSLEEYTGQVRNGIKEGGDKQFEYFKTPKNSIHGDGDGDGDPTWVWTRTPCASSTSSFYSVYSSGDTDSSHANYTLGVALSFWIRKS